MFGLPRLRFGRRKDYHFRRGLTRDRLKIESRDKRFNKLDWDKVTYRNLNRQGFGKSGGRFRRRWRVNRRTIEV